LLLNVGNVQLLLNVGNMQLLLNVGNMQLLLNVGNMQLLLSLGNVQLLLNVDLNYRYLTFQSTQEHICYSRLLFLVPRQFICQLFLILLVNYFKKTKSSDKTPFYYFDTITQESGIFISHKTIVETVVQRMSRLT
jgi:hypothetical protein